MMRSILASTVQTDVRYCLDKVRGGVFRKKLLPAHTVSRELPSIFVFCLPVSLRDLQGFNAAFPSCHRMGSALALPCMAIHRFAV